MDDSLLRLYDRTTALLASIPGEVTILAAAKQRTIEEVKTVVKAGIRFVGHNYVQEGQAMVSAIGNEVQWHLIGHLQRNKARIALTTFDMIQTLDSVRLAEAIQNQCEALDITYSVLIEINSAEEQQKSGVLPGDLGAFIEQVSRMDRLLIMGLLSMGPLVSDAEQIRPFFRLTRKIYDDLHKQRSGNLRMQFLSMGMSNSYEVAIQEGATMVRIGTALFGERVNPENGYP
jgi:PLP dependent protein